MKGQNMKIAIASDHAGYNLKEEIKKHLAEKNIEFIDYGTNSCDSVDYPDFAYPAATSVRDHQTDFGILVCYTGIGMSITANKVRGIRAALVENLDAAKLTREHNNANVLCLSAKDLSLDGALKIVDTFLNTTFLGGRHERRVNKIMEIEQDEK